jgi:hypothetical protein
MSTYREILAALSPTHYWHFDETSGTTADDAVGSADGTYQGSPTLGATGLIAEGNAATFAGNKNVTVADDADFKNFTSISIAFVMNLSGSMSAGSGFMTHHETQPETTAGSWYFSYWSSWLFFGGGNGTANQEIAQAASFNTGQRYHVGMVYTGSVVRFYVDGAQVGPDQAISGVGGNVSTATVRLAGENPLGWFPGTMDELAYWKNTALTSANFTAMAGSLDNAPGGGGGNTDPDRFVWNATTSRWDAQLAHVMTGSGWFT